ncbi:MAG: SGNH/GDSL hydrolase family protein [Nocardioidaceae bacterium]
MARRWITVLAAALLCTSACTAAGGAAPSTDPSSGPSSGPSAGGTPSAPSYASYVALGDSYTAGPLIETTDVNDGCFRSDHDYPSLLAKRLRITHLRDVSCSSARTRDLAHRQHTFRGGLRPPQLRAVRPGTDLVTLGMGGNDFDLFGTLVQRCTALRGTDPTGAPCTAQLRRTEPGLFGDIRRVGVRLTRSLDAIHRRAPHARVVLVGYLRLAPTHGTCPSRLPLADGDYPLANRVSRALRGTMRQAAAAGHATFVDMYQASAGHDACSARPWVNGRGSIPGVAIAYHPFVAGMHAVARQVRAALASP